MTRLEIILGCLTLAIGMSSCMAMGGGNAALARLEFLDRGDTYQCQIMGDSQYNAKKVLAVLDKASGGWIKTKYEGDVLWLNANYCVTIKPLGKS